MFTYTVAVNDGNEVIKHYPNDDLGYSTAYAHAKHRGYELWQSFNGSPCYLLRGTVGRAK